MVHKSTMSWDDVQFFLAVARAGSARAVAQAQQLSHSTVSRRIEQLESRLGTRLFDRGVKGYTLTAEGRTMCIYAEQAEDALVFAERALQGRDVELGGTIRLTTADVIATNLLMPEIGAFTRAYPAVHLDIAITSESLDLTQHQADLALRFLGYGAGPPEPLVGRKLGDVASCFYAAPKYLEEYDLNDPEGGANWLGWGGDGSHVWRNSTPFPNLPVQHSMTHGGLQLAAAKAGMGIAMLPCFLADNETGLVRLPNAQPQLKHEIWMLSHPDHRDVVRMRKLRDFLVDLFKRKQAILLGKL